MTKGDEPSSSSPVLEHLLRVVGQVLAFLEPLHHRQRQRLAIVRAGINDPPLLIAQRPVLLQIAEASRMQFAGGGPAVGVLAHRIDTKEVRLVLDRYTAAKATLGNLRRRLVPGGDLKSLVGGLEDLVEAEAELISQFQNFELRVIAALEKHADSADKGADNPRTPTVRLPGNVKVLQLARCLIQQRDDPSSEIDKATEFTDGDATEARGLLRQLRRFPHLKIPRRR